MDVGYPAEQVLHAREGNDACDECVLADGELAGSDFGVSTEGGIVHGAFDDILESTGLEVHLDPR